jgi:hypothetical protein
MRCWVACLLEQAWERHSFSLATPENFPGRDASHGERGGEIRQSLSGSDLSNGTANSAA